MDAVDMCAWQFRIGAVSVSCVAHDDAAPVGRQTAAAGRCELRPATVCHICVREVTPRSPYPGGSRSFGCERCRRLDRALARPFGARAMTPLEGQSSVRGSLLGRLFPDRVPHEVEEVATRANGLTMTVRVLTEPDPHPMTLLRDHARALGLAMVQAAVEVNGGPASLQNSGENGASVVRWEEWAGCFPASDEASARAYQRYVAQAHPWIETVEPRVADLEWLVGVLRVA